MAIGYDGDFAAWGMEQAEALRAGRLDSLDCENLAGEIEGLVRSDKRALASQIERLVLHLLKWRFQPSHRSTSWQRSILHARAEIADLLEDSPSLKADVSLHIARRYRAARAGAADETGLPLACFPRDCPFPAEAVLSGTDMGESEDLA